MFDDAFRDAAVGIGADRLTAGSPIDPVLSRLNSLNSLAAPATGALAARLSDETMRPTRDAIAHYARTLQTRDTKRADGEIGQLSGVNGITEFVQMLEAHPTFGTDTEIGVGIDLFEESDNPVIGRLRADASEVIVAGAIALGSTVGPVDPYVRTLLHIAFGADLASNLLRHVLRGKPGLPPTVDIPKDLLRFGRELLQKSCMLGLSHALSRYGAAVGATRIDVWTTGIRALSPDKGCAGDTISILGAGFGAIQDKDIIVLMPRYGGGCLSAEVISWSDNKVVVLAPAGVGWGYVGFSRRLRGGASLAGAAGELAGQMGMCLHKPGLLAGEHLIKFGSQPILKDPDSLPGGANLFRGGPPLVKQFVGNGSFTAVDLTPDATLRLSWEVRGADAVTIAPIQPAGQPKALPDLQGSLNPATGSYTFPTVAGPGDWDGAYELRATNDCTARSGQPMSARVAVRMRRRIAIVLSGGGARGDFEVGALQYLYDKGIRPRILIGTSVGSVNAAKLAEGDDTPTEAVPNPLNPQQKLEAIWRSLMWNNQMYVAEPWVDQLPISSIKDFFKDGLLDAAGNAAFAGGQVLARWSLFPPAIMADLIAGVITVAEVANAVEAAMAARSIYNLGPLETQLRNTDLLDPLRVRNSGITLRLAVVSLETGELMYVTESGQLLGTGGGTVDLVDAVMASSAIPVIFPPRKLADHNCVDGGVREILPLRAAVEAGASEVYAIMATAPVPLSSSFDQETLSDIGLRAIGDIMCEEITLNDVQPFGGWPQSVKVFRIRPTFDVHDTLTIDPGQIDIAMGYGYMRAADIVDPTANQAYVMTLADRISELRRQCWDLEYYANGARRLGRTGPLVPVPDPSALQTIRQTKRAIRDLVLTRRQFSAPVPPRVEAWWQQWERHPWTPLIPTPWDYFVSRLGTLPAEQPPPV